MAVLINGDKSAFKHKADFHAVVIHDTYHWMQNAVTLQVGSVFLRNARNMSVNTKRPL